MMDLFSRRKQQVPLIGLSTAVWRHSRRGAWVFRWVQGGNRTNLDGGRIMDIDWVGFALHRYTVVPIEWSTNSELIECRMISTTISIRDARILECVMHAHISTSARLFSRMQKTSISCEIERDREALYQIDAGLNDTCDFDSRTLPVLTSRVLRS